MMNKKTIAFTGGGSAGHVYPAFPIIDRLTGNGYEVFWIGSTELERQLVEQAGIPFVSISAGKLRRYWSWKNIVDLFHTFRGLLQSIRILRVRQPDLLFSKGGFVSVPPVTAARILGIPSFTHESDVNPGLATRLNIQMRALPLVTYKKTVDYMKKSLRSITTVVGNPVRDVIFEGNMVVGREIAGLLPEDTRPLLLVLGGSQGAEEINNLIDNTVDDLLPFLAIVHQTGTQTPMITNQPGYFSKSFFNDDEIPHLLAAANLALSRSGAGAVWELAASSTPAIFLPLRTGSRGDQILNASMAEKAGFSCTLEKNIKPEALTALLRDLLSDDIKIKSMKEAAANIPARDAADNIVAEIEKFL